MKLCVNCKHSHCYGLPGDGMTYCRHPNVGINPVDGKVKSTFAVTCRSKRMFAADNLCGLDGDWYEEKEAPPPAPKGWFTFIRGK